MDVGKLMQSGEFFFADCLVIAGVGIFSFSLVDGKVVVDDALAVDIEDITDIFENFSVLIDSAIYAGGESAGHGSCGYFCKWLEGRLVWAVMSLESDPFVGALKRGEEIVFLSASRTEWVVRENGHGLNVEINKLR